MSERAFNTDGSPYSGTQVIQTLRAMSDTVLLAFSGGKDSIALWLALRDHFPCIIPFHLYLIPNLHFVEESLRYYEHFFGTKILRLPHPSLYRMLNSLVFQPPERIRLIEAAQLPNYHYDDVTDLIKKEYHLPTDTFVVTGVRAADSPNRRAAVSQYGAINWKRHNAWPIWDMLKDELIALLNSHDCKLPVDYDLFGRSFDGLDYRFLKPIKDRFPEDYATILEWFPLARLELMRYGEPNG